MAGDLDRLLYEGNILNRVTDLETQVKTLKSGTLKVTVLDHIANDMGLQIAGEFRAGNGVEPGNGFSGVRMGSPSFTYDGEQWNLVGVNADTLEFGVDATTGKAMIGGRAIIMGSDGIKIYNGALWTGWLKNNGDLFFGSDLSDPNKTSLCVFATAQTYNGEAFLAGDELMGSNSAGYANIKISPSAGTAEMRNGQVTQSDITFSGTGGSITAGGILLSGLTGLLHFVADYLGEHREAEIGMTTPSGATAPVFSQIFLGPAGTNLVTNGNAETGNLNGWTDADTAWFADSADPYAGVYAFRHNCQDDTCPNAFLQNVAVTAGVRYSISFAAKMHSGILQPYVTLIWKKAGGAVISTETMYGNGTNSWVVNTGLYLAPALAASVDINFYPGDPFNDVSLDDIQLSVQAVSRQFGFYPDLTLKGGPINLEEQ